jgi:hypothetical protein
MRYSISSYIACLDYICLFFRYKQGKGDPIGFASYLKKMQIPVGAFPRYVGNRLHVVFHLAGVTIRYKVTLLEFFRNWCKSRGGLAVALLTDLQNEDLLSHLQVLGLLGKKLTGPWMEVFYTEEVDNLDSIPHMKSAVSWVKELVKDPSQLRNPTLNAFGESLDQDDPVLCALLREPSPDAEVIEGVAKKILEVLERQLKPYLDHEFTDEERKMASSAPSHNIASERNLGIGDHLARRAPNATMHHIESKVKWFYGQ